MSSGKRSQSWQEADLGRWRLVEEFRERVAAVAARSPLAASWSDRKRQLELGQYLGLFLFGLLNPVVRTMRGLCAASDLERVQRTACGRPVSLGSFSEAQAVVDPALLEQVFQELLVESGQRAPGPGARLAGRPEPWLVVDSTLWEALPRMHWALWRHQGTTQHAVRLHVGFHLLEERPVRAQVTAGRVCERQAWREQWQPGEAYIGDRYFGEDYGLLQELDTLGCTYLLRLREQAHLEVEAELPVDPADASAHVLRQAWVRLGSRACARHPRVRVVWVQTPKEVLLLVTNRPPAELSAALVAALYRQRWQVELFFRWIKCLLGCRHWLAESPKGVALQIHLALIAAVLLQLYSGRRPTRRMWERIEFYLLGVASADELQRGLEREWQRLDQQAKNKTI